MNYLHSALLLFCLQLYAEPIIRYGDIDFEALDIGLTGIDRKSNAAQIRNENVLSLEAHLQEFFVNEYLKEVGDPVTEGEVEAKIDELLEMAYGEGGVTVERYRQQVSDIAEIAELMRVFARDPDAADALYLESYTSKFDQNQWKQMKLNFTSASFEGVEAIVSASIPTIEEIRAVYQGQARAFVVDAKLRRALEDAKLNFDDWRAARFSQVQILNGHLFDKEALALLGIDQIVMLDSSEKVAIESQEQHYPRRTALLVAMLIGITLAVFLFIFFRRKIKF